MNSVRTAGPIVTGEAPFDSPIRRNDDGVDFGSIGSTWHVPPCQGLPKNSHAPTGQTRGTTDPKRSHAYCTNLKSIGGAVPVGCMLHAPQANNVFDVESSGLRKL